MMSAKVANVQITEEEVEEESRETVLHLNGRNTNAAQLATKTEESNVNLVQRR